MTSLKFPILALALLAQPAAAITITLFDFAGTGPTFQQNLVVHSDGQRMGDGTGLVRVGYFRDFNLSDYELRISLSLDKEVAYSYVSSYFVPVGEGLPSMGTPTQSALGFRTRTVNGASDSGRLGGSFLNITVTGEPANSAYSGNGVPAGSRMFLLIYDAATPEASSEMGVFSAENWLLSPLPPVLAMRTTDVNTSAEVFRGSLGSLVLAPLNLPEPGSVTLSLAAAGLLLTRRRK